MQSQRCLEDIATSDNIALIISALSCMYLTMADVVEIGVGMPTYV